MGGMIAAMLLGIFFTPVFYMLARRYLSKRRDPQGEDAKWEAQLAKEGETHA
ncbi:MAG TPA: hypothetical protein VF503_16030 [Sphingobium sp.]|uniref:hypothetical protein n=1 Tax=Sphingobium sp. TaxID=1912891 RepID=UPI002ED0DC80